MKKFPTKFRRYYVSEDGTVWREDDEGQLYALNSHYRGGQPVPGGRYRGVNVSIYDEEGKFVKQTKQYVHRLVAETLIPNPDNLPEINHKNRLKHDNCVSNLEWTTKKNNMEWAAKPFKVYDERTDKTYEGVNLFQWVEDNWEWIRKRTKVNCPTNFARYLQGSPKRKLVGLDLLSCNK